LTLIKLEVPPGVVKRGTTYKTAGRWSEASLVRWWQQVMGPIGGWVKRTTSAMTGSARMMLTWRDNTNVRWIAVGTNSKLYAFSQSLTVGADITPAAFVSGSASATAAGGYGGGTYGAGTYGTPRTDSTTIQDAEMWTLDTFGQYLIGTTATDGRLFEWQLNTGTPAAALGGTSPIGNSAVVVTPERFVMALGAGGVIRRVQWGDQESDSIWTPSATNQAGDFDLQSYGRLMCGRRLRAQTIIFTDLDAHVAEYIGYPYIYRFTRIGENCGIVSRGAVATTDTRAYWMSVNGFYLYDGITQPIPCEVYDYVYSDINITQRSKIIAVLNSQFNEVWWFYPSGASTENDRAVSFNYLEGHWNTHLISRTCASDRGVFVYPIYGDASGDLWDHENGVSYTNAAVTTPYAISGPLEIGVGERIGKARELIPDEETLGEATVTFLTADTPMATETTVTTTPGAYTPVRFAARQARMKVAFTTPTGARWGAPRLDVVAGGRR
jgi:hypothetical protein